MSEHSVIPPSSAHIWGPCSGWGKMVEQCPDLSTHESAAEGEASHEIGAAMIVSAQTAGKGAQAPSLEDLIGMPASNGVIITEEMFEGAELYADDVRREMLARGVFDVGVEVPLKAPRVHALSFGTTDCYLHDRRANHLIIWDYKFGRILVEAFENAQGINYFGGLYDDLVLNEETIVELRIAQPRAYHREGPLRSWTVKAGYLLELVEKLAVRAKLALSDGAMLATGPHCRRCHCRYGCSALLAAGNRYLEATGAPVPMTPSPSDLGLLYTTVQQARERLKGLESGYEEQIKSLIRSGTNVPGWGNEPTIGRECWAKPFGEIVAMGEMLKHDMRSQKPSALLTPNQARTAGVDPSIVSAYSKHPQTGFKLVPQTEKDIRKVFGS